MLGLMFTSDMQDVVFAIARLMMFATVMSMLCWLVLLVIALLIIMPEGLLKFVLMAAMHIWLVIMLLLIMPAHCLERGELGSLDTSQSNIKGMEQQKDMPATAVLLLHSARRATSHS